mmetsp:Transcript_30612/g.65089  ORF Transcript_30612/g.65089 Transcript_30612/m.65089 type:complete len:82 (-) Transcript_30612:117-362(-)
MEGWRCLRPLDSWRKRLSMERESSSTSHRRTFYSRSHGMIHNIYIIQDKRKHLHGTIETLLQWIDGQEDFVIFTIQCKMKG